MKVTKIMFKMPCLIVPPHSEKKGSYYPSPIGDKGWSISHGKVKGERDKRNKKIKIEIQSGWVTTVT